ncbi:hypothetical protein Tco_1057383 [Tanacetum coccineum]|uniref:Retrotransposon gag domain-containing protein n=1 Tax=Tanacetum coccineum TaxID=301880 RepID=A0ABQ5H5G4_9ASTR
MSTDKESSAARTDNRHPMLVESDYDSWKIRIHRYIQNGPSPHPMVTNAPTEGQTGVNMPIMKLDSEFTPEETNCENAEYKAESFSIKVSSHIFNILNQTNTAKEIWDNVEMLMQGKTKPIHDYFVRFHKLVNDIKITQLEIPTH